MFKPGYGGGKSCRVVLEDGASLDGPFSVPVTGILCRSVGRVTRSPVPSGRCCALWFSHALRSASKSGPRAGGCRQDILAYCKERKGITVESLFAIYSYTQLCTHWPIVLHVASAVNCPSSLRPADLDRNVFSKIIVHTHCWGKPEQEPCLLLQCVHT